MTLRIALVGRPNVGKSTLFNRLSGKRLAITHDLPGLTRDWREADAKLGPFKFKVLDTAGLEVAAKGSLADRMVKQTEQAMQNADICLFMLDYKVGIIGEDEVFKKWLHKTGMPVIVVYNKSEKTVDHDVKMRDALKLGFGAPVCISAEHNDGMVDLFDALLPMFEEDEKNEQALELEGRPTPLSVAIVGRPNAGKSTLVNTLVGKERMLTGPEPGITRDSIAIDWEYKGRAIKLVDTAGLRKKANITHNIEELTVSDSIRAIQYAQVVVLVVDADIALEKQDLTIANHVIKEGRSLILAVNKADLIDNEEAYLDETLYRISKVLPSLKNLHPVMISAKTGKNIDKMMEIIFKTFECWNMRVSTSKLNEWLKDMVTKHPVPLGKRNLPVKLKYITQARTRPPTFMISTTKPDEIPLSYERYLTNSLITSFGFEGVPIRLHFKKSENPFGKKK